MTPDGQDSSSSVFVPFEQEHGPEINEPTAATESVMPVLSRKDT